MAQYDIDLRDYWRVIRKRRSIILFSMITMAVLSFVFAKFKQNTTINYYASSATVRIDKAADMQDKRLQAYRMTGTDEIETEVKSINSFPVMSEAARRFGAIAVTDSDEVIKHDPDLMSVVNNLTSLVSVERSEFTNIITISAMGYAPAEARDLAQITAEAYRDSRRTKMSKSLDNTIAYLKGELGKNEKDLAEKKEALKKYTTENDSLMPYYTSNTLQQDMLGLYRQQNDLDARETTIKSMIDGIKKRGTIDESSVSGAFADQEGSTFRNNYTSLLGLLQQRGERLQYFTEQHPEVKAIDSKVESTRKSLIDQLQGSLNTIQNRRKGFADVSLNLRKQVSDVNTKREELRVMEKEISLMQDKQVNLMSQLQLNQIKKSEEVDEVTIITPATIDPRPVNKAASPMSVTLIGIFLGLVIGLVFGFVFEALDTSIGTIEDVEAYLNIPVIGLIPQIELSQLKYKYGTSKYGAKGYDGSEQKEGAETEMSNIHARLVIKYAPKSPIAESYRALRTNIQFISFESEAKVLMFSSSSPGEGKTTTIVNLALTMAQSGNRVLLIDADMRKPRLNQIFGLERERGLSEIILGNHPWRESVKTVTDIITGEYGMTDIVLTPGIDNLHIITCGAIPPNPSELLNSDMMDEFIREARKEYDMILFDCTPILPATDPAVLGRKVDGSVLVYAVGKVSRGSLKRAKAQMDNVKARIVGVILNGMRGDNSGDYPEYKYNESYYGIEEETAPETKVGKVKKALGGIIGRFS